MIGSKRALGRRLAGPVGFLRDLLLRFVELQGFDRAVALAGQAFTTIVPLFIVYSAIVSDRTGRDFADKVNRTFHLKGDSADMVRQAVAPPDTVEGALNVLGVLLLVGSALAFTRALQRLYQLTWYQPSLGLRAAQWGLLWLGLVIVLITARTWVLDAAQGTFRVVLTLAFSGLLWLATPYVLLARRVAWRRLAPMAAMTGLGMTALGVASVIWMPRTVSTSASQFGVIGVAFALLTWLVGAGLVLVVTAAAASVTDGRLHPPAPRAGAATE